MGIDPGTTRTGYGVLEVDGGSGGGRLYAVTLGDIDLRRERDTYQKLRVIFERVCELVDSYHPDEVALESPFFGENVQSMLKLGRAQGVAMAAALSRGLPVYEYAPRRVKQAITGQGAAAKEQVAAMLGSMLGIEYNPRRLDATDGMAVALCHHFMSSSARILGAATSGAAGAVSGSGTASVKKTRGQSVSSWEDFLRQNPGREVK
uniref:Putative crossover junction endo-deoxy-ribonuclease n=1 Tax=termite gut metagenome TaxID=433724 RepID=S0DFY2_9ZZZZ